MSEKRFELEISSFSGKHMKFLNILDNGKRLNSEEIVDLLNEQQATITAQKKGLDEYMDNIIALSKENEQLKERLYDFEKRKIIEESEIDEDVIPKVKLLRTELFGEKYE